MAFKRFEHEKPLGEFVIRECGEELTIKPAKTTRSSRRRLGQYYTPDWVVDYIVQHTLGPAIRGDPERLLGEFTVLDPACGDGAFLVGVLRYLTKQVPSTGKQERRFILRSLVDCIHGVDIDPKAVTLCRDKLTLTAKKLLKHSAGFDQRILLGNSLLHEDEHALAIFSDDLEKRNPLAWHRVYPWVMRDGGFDVILGNPPFIGVKAIDEQIKAYIRRRYRTVHQQFDILIAFIELSLQLLRSGGRLGFVISNKVLAADYGTLLRKHLVSSYVIEHLVDLSHLDVFKNVATYPFILILRKPQNPDEVKTNTISIHPPPDTPEALTNTRIQPVHVPQRYYTELPNTILTPALTPTKFNILQRMHTDTTPLGQLCDIRCGIAKTGFTKRVLSKAEYIQLSKTQKLVTRNFLAAGDVHRYTIKERKYLTYYPDISNPEQWKDFGEDKIVIAGMGKHLRAAMDLHGNALGRVYYITKSRASFDLYYLLALLNSRLINAYYSLVFAATRLRGGYIRYNASYLQQIPLPEATYEDQLELANLALQVHKKPRLLKKEEGSKIDQHVALLFRLTPDDVNVLDTN